MRGITSFCPLILLLAAQASGRRLLGSDGVVIAVHAGHGNRMADEDKDYKTMLPTPLIGRVVFNTLFLHAGMREKPYRIEDFRGAFAAVYMLPDIVALGAYQVTPCWR